MKPALNNKPLVILSAITLILAAAVVGLLIFMKNQPAPKRGIQPLIQLAALEPNPALWGENFPNEYSTLLLSQDAPGTKAPSKLAADPRLVELFLGTGFSKDYNEPRGHMNSLTDVRTTLRVNDKTPGTCYSCKSSNNPGLWTQMGMEAFDKTPFSALTPQIQNPIGCANCHEANTMRLVITNPAVETALKSEGINWQTATRQQMRSLVCANCHVNYYFAGDAKLLTVPWQNGTTIEALEKTYDQVNFSDFTHPESGAGLVKIRHPDYELYTAGSTHYTAGVSCADCHMPYLRDGAAKFSSHT
ncbi:MAG TPA: ammonia-forming cytochrome c nitrite reductase subunit c552, partial [Anaerolineaceae bacterium]